MHTTSIIWFLLWPAFIVVSYFVIRWVIGKVEKKNPPAESEG